MPITLAKAGDSVVIQKLTGGDKTKQHLRELGFVEGEEVTVINTITGNLILQVKESRIALSESMAVRILI